MYTYEHTHTLACIHTKTCMSMHIHTHTEACMYACTHTQMHTDVHLHTHTNAFTHTHKCTNTMYYPDITIMVESAKNQLSI